MFYDLKDKKPKNSGENWVAPNATVIGDVTLEKNPSIWFKATLRGDIENIHISEVSNVQDGSVLHKDSGCHLNYVKAVTKDIVEDFNELKIIGINSVAICANDAENSPEDSFENMIEFSKKNHFGFPYLHDETQEIAKTYDAVCTHDFVGYNKHLELQYRGRLRELKNLVPVRSGASDLLKAMRQIAETGKGPESQIPSAGCGIKWKQ